MSSLIHYANLIYRPFQKVVLSWPQSTKVSHISVLSVPLQLFHLHGFSEGWFFWYADYRLGSSGNRFRTVLLECQFSHRSQNIHIPFTSLEAYIVDTRQRWSIFLHGILSMLFHSFFFVFLKTFLNPCPY